MMEISKLLEGVFIDGSWRAAEAGLLTTEEPATGRVLARIARGGEADVAAAVSSARRAFDQDWGQWTAVERGRVLTHFASLIQTHHEALARTECADTGKPLTQARNDITATARYFEYYGGAADKLHGETIPYQSGTTVVVQREPFGVCGLITPWNYPAQIFGRTVGGALAAGNTVVLKPAEEACLTVLRLTELAAEAGIPPGVLNVVPGLGHEAGVAVASHPDVDHLSFTGSPVAGTAVAQAAAVNHVPVTLELGGKSAQLVFADADLDMAAEVIVRAIVQNAGQTCSAGSRVLVEASARDALVARLDRIMSGLVCGPGIDDHDCGPLINAAQKTRLENMLERGRSAGMSVLAQGHVAPDAPDGGHYVPPMLVTGVPPDHEVAREELFGPVLTLFTFTDDQAAVELANATDYGLVTGLWTQDAYRSIALPGRLRSGQVFVNNYGAGGGVELPFGGMKRSGYGREKGFEGMKSFTTMKTVTFSHGQ